MTKWELVNQFRIGLHTLSHTQDKEQSLNAKLCVLRSDFVLCLHSKRYFKLVIVVYQVEHVTPAPQKIIDSRRVSSRE